MFESGGMPSFFTRYYDYLEEKWLSIAFEFRIVILVSVIVVLLMLVLYLYFFNASTFSRLFCCRLFRRQSKKKKRPKMPRETQAANEENAESRIDNLDKDRYCDKFDGNERFEDQRSLKAKRAHSRGHSFKPLPSTSVSMSEIKSELGGNNSFANEDFNQQVKQKDDNLIDSINKYKHQLNTNIKLINKQGSIAKVPAGIATRPAPSPSLSTAKEAGPTLSPKSEYNLIKVVAEDQPRQDEEPAIKEPKLPRKIELAPAKTANDSVYSGFSQHLQEPRPDEPESKKNADDEKKHSAFSSFN